MANSSTDITAKIAELRQQMRSYAQQRAEGLIDVDLQRELVKDIQAEIADLESQLDNNASDSDGSDAPEHAITDTVDELVDEGGADDVQHAQDEMVEEIIDAEVSDDVPDEDTHDHPEIERTDTSDEPQHAVTDTVDELVDEGGADDVQHAQDEMVEEIIDAEASDDVPDEDTHDHPEIERTDTSDKPQHAVTETVDELVDEGGADDVQHAQDEMVEEIIDAEASDDVPDEDTHDHPEIERTDTSDEPQHADTQAVTEVIEEEDSRDRDEDNKPVKLGDFTDDVVVSSAMVKEPDYLNEIHEPNVVDIRDITKTYKMGEFDLQVLKGITMQVRQGEFISIMGPSGSGKSTLMNILGALDQPTSGEYYLDNVDVSKLSEKELAEIRNSKIGFVFQSFNLLKRTPAQRQVELPLIYGSHKDRARKAREALESVGLGQRLDHTPAELSGGQQQRVAIARALVTEPSLILADEPTGNLDSRSGTEVMQIFQSLNRKNNITTIFVTHDPWIARHTDRVIMLRDGNIIADQRVKNPLVAGEAERPSEAEELQAIFDSTYYGGDEEEYT